MKLLGCGHLRQTGQGASNPFLVTGLFVDLQRFLKEMVGSTPVTAAAFIFAMQHTRHRHALAVTGLLAQGVAGLKMTGGSIKVPFHHRHFAQFIVNRRQQPVVGQRFDDGESLGGMAAGGDIIPQRVIGAREHDMGVPQIISVRFRLGMAQPFFAIVPRASEVAAHPGNDTERQHRISQQPWAMGKATLLIELATLLQAPLGLVKPA